MPRVTLSSVIVLPWWLASACQFADSDSGVRDTTMGTESCSIPSYWGGVGSVTVDWQDVSLGMNGEPFSADAVGVVYLASVDIPPTLDGAAALCVTGTTWTTLRTGTLPEYHGTSLVLEGEQSGPGQGAWGPVDGETILIDVLDRDSHELLVAVFSSSSGPALIDLAAAAPVQ